MIGVRFEKTHKHVLPLASMEPFKSWYATPGYKTFVSVMRSSWLDHAVDAFGALIHLLSPEENG